LHKSSLIRGFRRIRMTERNNCRGGAARGCCCSFATAWRSPIREGTLGLQENAQACLETWRSSSPTLLDPDKSIKSIEFTRPRVVPKGLGTCFGSECQRLDKRPCRQPASDERILGFDQLRTRGFCRLPAVVRKGLGITQVHLASHCLPSL
jgi:hypothetical protein